MIKFFDRMPTLMQELFIVGLFLVAVGLVAAAFIMDMN